MRTLKFIVTGQMIRPDPETTIADLENAIKEATSDVEMKKLETDYQINNAWYRACDEAEESYRTLIANGMRPEQARCVLP